ncbi:hypothetical protein ACVBEG_20370 [Pseudomonas sp. GG8]
MQNVKIKFAYRHGFRRAWVVTSILWIAFILYFLIVQNSRVPTGDILMSSLIPPFVLYLLGAAVVWIIEGSVRPYR